MIFLVLFLLCLTNVSQAALVPPGATGRPVDKVPQSFRRLILSFVCEKLVFLGGAGLERILDMQNWCMEINCNKL